MSGPGEVPELPSELSAFDMRHRVCLPDGFDEALALSGDTRARAIPASFPEPSRPHPQPKNGSVAYS